jgi:hypothetical protein
LLDKDKISYIREKRKKLIFSIIVLGGFGFLLYSGTLIKETNEKNETLSGGLYDIAKKLDNENEETGYSYGTSGNLLAAPVSVPFTIENDELKVKGSFKVKKEKVVNAVFKIDAHGSTIYSKGFVSDSLNLFCKGTMKKGNDRLFIYFCEEKAQ